MHTDVLAGWGRKHKHPRAGLAGGVSVPLPSMGLPASDWSNYEALLPRPSYSKEGRGYASRSTTIPQVRTYLRQEGERDENTPFLPEFLCGWSSPWLSGRGLARRTGTIDGVLGLRDGMGTLTRETLGLGHGQRMNAR